MARPKPETSIRLLFTAQAAVSAAILGMVIFGVVVLHSVSHRTTESVVLTDIHRESIVIGDRLQGWVTGSESFLSEPLDLERPVSDLRLGTATLRAFSTSDEVKADDIDRRLDLMLAAIERMADADDPAAIYTEEVAALQQTFESVFLQYQVGEMADLENTMGLVGMTQRLLLFLGPPLVILAFLTIPAISRLRDRAERVEAAERLVRSKDEFLAKVSHEIRTPLTGILGLTEMLRDETPEPGETSELIATVADQSTELAGIVDDLLVASVADIKELPIRLATVDLRRSVDAVVASFSDQASVAVRAENAHAAADRARVHQVLRNLVSNALLHGGDDIAVSVSELEGVARITVSDDGPAIPAAEAARIFEPYATQLGRLTGPSAMGIGLSISRDLARRMGGDLACRHTGTRSEFTLALVAARSPRRDDSVARAPGADQKAA